MPYKGTGPAMNDLLGGQVDFMCDQTTNTTAQIKGGKVKVYGVTTMKRVPSLPDIPTLDEQGLKGFEVGIWHALYVPKGTPKPVVDRLVAALQESIKDPDFKANLAKLGSEPVSADRATPEALRTFLKAEIDKWGPIIKKAGLTPTSVVESLSQRTRGRSYPLLRDSTPRKPSLPARAPRRRPTSLKSATGPPRPSFRRRPPLPPRRPP